MKEPFQGKRTETDTEGEGSKTRYGVLELLKPQLREFPFQTQVFERYCRESLAKRCCGVLHTRIFHEEDKRDNSYLEW